MRGAGKKHKTVDKLYSWPVLAILALATLFVVRGTWGMYEKMSESRANVIQAQTKLNELMEREQELTGLMNKLETTDGIEEEIVQKYNVAKEGERVIHIVDEPQDIDVAPKEDERGFFGSVWFKIKNIF